MHRFEFWRICRANALRLIDNTQICFSYRHLCQHHVPLILRLYLSQIVCMIAWSFSIKWWHRSQACISDFDALPYPSLRDRLIQEVIQASSCTYAWQRNSPIADLHSRPSLWSFLQIWTLPPSRLYRGILRLATGSRYLRWCFIRIERSLDQIFPKRQVKTTL
jgi:hypothetical protein